MNLFKTSILSAIASVIKIVVGLVITKFVAIVAGTNGLAFVGHLQNFVNIVLLFSGNMFKTAIVRHTASCDDDDELKSYWSSSLRLAFFISSTICVFIFFSSQYLSELLFKDDNFAYVLKAFSICIPVFILNNIFIGIINGKSEVKLLTIINILSSLLVLVVSASLIHMYSLGGALLAISINQALIILITIFFLRKKPWFKPAYFMAPVDSKYIKDILSFASITLFSVFFANASTFLVRYVLMENLGIKEAGMWQGMWSICQAFLLILSMSMSVYIVPKISKIEKDDIKNEVKVIVNFIFPVFLSVCILGFILRDYIILALFTDEFMELRSLFLWHMIGLSLKSLAWVFGYILVIKKQLFSVFITEFFAALLLVVTTTYFVNLFGVIGTSYSFFITSTAHCLLTFFFYKKYLR